MTAVVVLSLFVLPISKATFAQATESPTQEQNDQETGESFDPQVHLDSFDEVWETIAKVHWDPEKVGESWQQARETFRPQVASAQSDDEARQAINDLLESLGQSHFGIIPAKSYSDIEEQQAGGGEASVGLEARLIGDQFVVTRVNPEMPAAAAGVRPGWIITAIGEKTTDEMLTSITKAAEHSVVRTDTMVGLACDARTSGTVGDTLQMSFLNEHDDAVDLEFTLQKSPGELERLGNLPPFTVDYESKLLDNEIGYIRFNAFIGGPRLAKGFADSIKEFRSARGLVIDLRGNRGGLVGLVTGMCGWMARDKAPIGVMSLSGGTEFRLALNPRRPRFDRPVAVLIDECSISAAEIMSGGMKDLNMARVFGSRTAGLALPSIVTKLPNGDGFQYAMAWYESASGDVLESNGVIPTDPIDLDRNSLLETPDPVMEAAEAWILGDVADEAGH